MSETSVYAEMLKVAIDEARAGLAEGGIPIGAALWDANGKLLGIVWDAKEELSVNQLRQLMLEELHRRNFTDATNQPSPSVG